MAPVPGAPATVALAVGPGLVLGGATTDAACTPRQAGRTACPVGARVGTGLIGLVGLLADGRLVGNQFTFDAFNAPGGRALTIFGHDLARRERVMTARLDQAATRLEFALPEELSTLPGGLGSGTRLAPNVVSIALGRSGTHVGWIRSTGCMGSWNVSESLTFPGSAPIDAQLSIPCTPGRPPARVPPPRALFLTQRALRAGDVIGRLLGIAGLRSLPRGTVVTARCVRSCGLRTIGRVTLRRSTPRGVQIRLRNPVRLTRSTRIELEVTRTGYLGRFATYRFLVADSVVLPRRVAAGCLNAVQSHVAC